MIKVVIFSICLAWVFVNVVNKNKWLNFKPFTCDFCLSGWVGLVISIYYGYYIEALALMACSMVSIKLLNGIFDKL